MVIMMKRKNLLTIYRKLAEKQVRKILKSRDDIIAAYSDGSVARGDLFEGSDIDIAFIIENSKKIRLKEAVSVGNVYRTINKKNDVLIEWAFIPKEEYLDANKILSDAGFTHDIKDAYVYYDPTGFFSKIKKEIHNRYKDKLRILKASRNQLNAFRQMLKNIEHSIRTKNRTEVNDSLRSLMKFSAGFPRAVLNQPLTNTRAIIWCKQATKELGASDYYDLILELLGSKNLKKEDAQEFLNLAKKIVSLEEKNKNQKETLLHHLKAPQYLIDSGHWDGSFYKVLLWTGFAVKEANKNKRRNKKLVNEYWKVMLNIINWHEWKDIRAKIIIGKKIVKIGSRILKEHQ